MADRLSRDEQLDVVTNGKGDMLAWRDTLTPAEIEAVVDQREVLSTGDG